jgi:hypothetical protein
LIQIPLQAIPNQTLTVTLDQLYYTIYINSTNRFNDSPVSLGCMAITIIRAGVVIVTGQRIVCNYPLISYLYLESGNFALLTLNDALPDYTQFGITQSLIYISQADLTTLRASS